MNANTLPDKVDEIVGGWDALDPVAEGARKLVHDALHALPAGEAVEAVLHGRPLGHPLHPILVEIPVGAFMTLGVLDALEIAGATGLEKGSNAVLAIGLAGAGGAIATGWTDWHETRGLPSRIGLVHGLMNEAVAVLYLGSLVARLKGRRGLGRALAYGGLAVAGVSAYLGGHLVYRHGVGVGGPMR